MRRMLLALGTILLVSCSAPREIIESNTVSPKCHCEGSGDYTIVMDAGMGNWSIFYQSVFYELKSTSKICIIDRAGYAMDTVSSNPRDAKTIALEIEKVLMQNGISDNIVLVGHSLGGLHVRMYQSLFPEKVKGMVLLDSAHPEQFNYLPSEFYNLQKDQANSLDRVIKLAQKDYLKYSQKKIPTFGIPDSLLPEYYQVTTQPAYYCSMKAEVVEFENSLKQVGNLNNLGNLPLLVVASKNSMNEHILPGKLKDYPFEKHNEIWFELQKELSQLSSNSTFVESDKDHYLNITDSKLVANKIMVFMNQNFKRK